MPRKAKLLRTWDLSLPERAMLALATRYIDSPGSSSADLQGIVAHDVLRSPDPLASATFRSCKLGLGHRIHSGIFREVMGMQGCFVLEVRKLLCVCVCVFCLCVVSHFFSHA